MRGVGRSLLLATALALSDARPATAQPFPATSVATSPGPTTPAQTSVGSPTGSLENPASPATAPSSERVRVSYDAPAECPSAEAFLAQVRARVGTEWEAPPGTLARTLDVRVVTDGTHSAAGIDYVDEGGKRVTRNVAAVTCAEVVSGIALVTALAIESRMPKSTAQAAPVDVPPAPVLPTLPPPVLVPSAAPPRTPIAGPAPHFDVGVGLLGVLGGGGPGRAFGPRGFLGMGWEGGPDFRVGVDVATALFWHVPAGGGADTQNRFTLYTGRLSACPLGFGSEIRMLPCAGLAGGVFHAESFSSGSVDPASGTTGFFMPFASLRADAAFDRFFVELEAEARFPLGGDRFVYSGTPTGEDVYTVPWVAFGASLAIGLRL